MRSGQHRSGNQIALSHREDRTLWHYVLPLSVVIIAILAVSGCAGLVSGSNASSTTPPPTLTITNVLAASSTTSSSQIAWTTNVAADSAIDYGTSTSYGSTTPVDSAMVTSHQMTLSGLAAGTTYYYQVRSTDSKGNHGQSGGHGFKTAGYGISGTISPVAGGNGATVTLSGTTGATITADSSGNYTFAGLPNGTYTVAPSHTGYTFSPSNQNVAVNGASVTSVNFTDVAQTFSISGTISPAAGGSGAVVTLSGASGGTTTANSSGVYTFTALVSGSYTVTPSNTGYVFSPTSQNVVLGTTNVTGVNFTANATAVAPTITGQPVSQTVTAGQSASFVVVATGTAPLSYQWQKNGANISGATAASYTTPATIAADSGSTFRVVVTNTAGTATSAAATLTVNAAPVAPTITTQPASQTVTAGQTATFTAVASGTAPLSYQWQRNGANISGATAASYTTPTTTTTDSGSTFRVVVTNTAGTATSAAATLTVNAAPVAPTITTQPVSQAVTAGQTATFTAVASGTAPLSYQWQKNGANIPGATAASYTTPTTTTTDSGSTFRAVVSNTAGTATSAAATLTVNAAPVAPTITTQPVSQTVTAGQTATLTVAASGTAPLSYQWQKNGANISGATSSSYTTSVTTASDNGSTFTVVVSNSAGTVTSAAATLTVMVAGPTITSLNPTSGVAGTSVTITGTNFAATQSTSTVIFNGTMAAPTSWSATSIVVPVPTGATTGNVVVTVGGLASNGALFTVTSTSSTMGPLVPAGTVQPGSNYFVVKGTSGPGIMLNGSHAWSDYQDQGNNGATVAVDFNGFVNFLVAHSQNATILQRQDLFQFCNWGAGGTWIVASDANNSAWQRTGPGTASDGLPKFDLSQFNAAYFTLLHARVLQLQNAGIYAVIELFDGHDLLNYRCGTTSPNGDGYPGTGVNNINGVDDGYTSGSSGGNSMVGSVLPWQQAYMQKVVDTVNDLQNVLYEPCKEAPDATWCQNMISAIHTYQSTKPNQHPVLFPVPSALNTTTVLNSNADLFAGSSRVAPTNNCGGGTPACKVDLNDSDHSYTMPGIKTDGALLNRNFVWENFVSGVGGIMFQDPWDMFWSASSRNLCNGGVAPTNGICPSNSLDLYWEPLRNNLGYATLLSRKLDLVKMSPSPVASTGWCLADDSATGSEFVVYAPNGGSFTVDLSAQAGRTLNYQWLDPTTGSYTSVATVTGGNSTQSFTPPWGSSYDAVLYIVDAAGHN